MTWLQWVLYAVLPAVGLTVLLVGVGGARLVGLTVGLAVFAPYALLRAVPPWPWQMAAGGGDAEGWQLWGVVAATLLGTLHDLRAWPRQLTAPPVLLLFAVLPWGLATGVREAWSFERLAGFLVAAAACGLIVQHAWRSALQAGAGLGVLASGVLVLVGDALLLWQSGPAAPSAAGTAATVAFLAMLVAAFRQPFRLGDGVPLALAGVHVAVLVRAAAFGVLSPVVAVVAGLAPVPLWLLTFRSAGPRDAAADPVRVGLGLVAGVVFQAVAWILLRR